MAVCKVVINFAPFLEKSSRRVTQIQLAAFEKGCGLRNGTTLSYVAAFG
jgi:hypothetical protein